MSSPNLSTSRTKKQQQRRLLARVYRHAQFIHTQDDLDHILLEIPNRSRRFRYFDMLKPMLKFKAVMTDEVAGYDGDLIPLTTDH